MPANNVHGLAAELATALLQRQQEAVDLVLADEGLWARQRGEKADRRGLGCRGGRANVVPQSAARRVEFIMVCLRWGMS